VHEHRSSLFVRTIFQFLCHFLNLLRYPPSHLKDIFVDPPPQCQIARDFCDPLNGISRAGLQRLAAPAADAQRLPMRGTAQIVGQVRIVHALGRHDAADTQSRNLKRKHLVKKTRQELQAPYSLTEAGRAALAEMTRRQAA
jgi:hypothetical protein